MYIKYDISKEKEGFLTLHYFLDGKKIASRFITGKINGMDIPMIYTHSVLDSGTLTIYFQIKIDQKIRQMDVKFENYQFKNFSKVIENLEPILK